MSLPKLKQHEHSTRNLVAHDDDDKSEIYVCCDSSVTAKAIADRLALLEEAIFALSEVSYGLASKRVDDLIARYEELNK